MREIPVGDRENWFAWRAGWKDWKPLTEVPELLGTAAAPNTTSQDYESLEAISPKNRRRHERHELRLRVIIRSAKVTFRTFTKDISLGGVQLENSIPEAIFGNACEIYIASLDHTQNIKFNLGPTARNDLSFFSFENIEPRFRDMLASWLKEASANAANKRAA